jgi:hypothetical protein
MRTISRRTLMQMMGAGAVALGAPFGKVSKAFAAREKEMNILCWEGYNSAQVGGGFGQPGPPARLPSGKARWGFD